MAGLCEGRVCIVTGAGRGIGRDYALMLAAEGAKVVVNDLGGSRDGTGVDQGPAQEVVDEILAAGGQAVANTDDISDWSGAENLINQAITTFGGLDVLINNAGILRDKSFHNMTPDLMNPVFDVHLKGAFHVTQPAYLIMREQGYGRIISTSSAAGIFGNFGQTNYGAAKMGLVGFTRVLAVEGAKFNIKANAIAPLALTRMTETLMGNLADKLGPEEVTPIVAMLAHEDCPVSGNIFSVGGGRVANVFIGETQGYTKPGHTLEDLRDNWDAIMSQDGYFVPGNLADETGVFFEKLK